MLIAEVLSALGEFPQERGQWRFPGADTFVLPVSDRSLWILSSPPTPLLELRDGRSPTGGRGSAFQQMLQARAGGQLLEVRQLKLDRVIKLEFGAGSGFVSTPPVTVVVELTGRNCNVLLLDEQGRILGVQREVAASRNRYRQLLPGLDYVPPPAYDRPDPRDLGAAGVADLLLGCSISSLRKLVDGIGPELTIAVTEAAGLSPEQTVGQAELSRVTAALDRLLEAPAALRQAALGTGGVAELRQAGERATLLASVEPAAKRRVALLERRLQDLERLEEAAHSASLLRQQADLLMALRPVAQPGAKVSITDWSGEEITVQLEPAQDALRTAETFYGRARKHEQRQETARNLRPRLEAELVTARQELQDLGNMSVPELRKRASRPEASTAQHRTQPGIRVKGPHGYDVIIGRNARDNDRVTFGIARSRDVWLHVQGYRGSHVIIRADAREVPFDTILFAARLAAGHSQAAGSSNVPVDYTLRKNVWRPKGAAAGAVHFSGQKTVFVDPLKDATQEDSTQV